jgi:hypothetical protein
MDAGAAARPGNKLNRGYRSNINWTMDYPRSDRHLLARHAAADRASTRRSVEQVVDLDGSDDIYNWPSLYAVEVGHWFMPDDQAKQLREYLLRGGFLMVDDFHGTTNGPTSLAGINKVLPGPADCRYPRMRRPDFPHHLRP